MSYSNNGNILEHHHLAAIEGFCITALGVAFHPAEAHQRSKHVISEPTFGMLGLEGRHDELELPLACFIVDLNKEVGLSQVAVKLRNFVLQDQVVAEGVPCEFRKKAVILMRISVVVRENNVRGRRLFQVFENGLDFGPPEWHKAVLKGVQ